MTTLLIDHPAWTGQFRGCATRLVSDGDRAWFALWTGSSLNWQALDSTSGPVPPVRSTPAADVPDRVPAQLLEALTALGTVQRLPNPSLWDAITTALLRRIIRAEQARLLYRRWCRTYGRCYDTPVGVLAAAPTPEVVLGLESDAYRDVGARFHEKALSAAAAAYLDRGAEWTALDPDDLVKALQEVSGVGPWTAAAAAADFTGDYAVYPHHDLAVRTWATKAAPGLDWPETERAFADQWHRWAPDRTQLHALTTFTLAWGIHAPTAEHHERLLT
ncbi:MULTISPECIES: hypothetical protein [Streptomyces]|uniref:DNA-3-methyladenine glycosylase 2 family protein n=1 Tax=Streptomyces rhizosphaericus TaxID=114699 RepID=A0A6G4ACV5_9ACTN|nr:hypothetical protein [Streptomyces rhizosphaericus]NEW71050.1 hypothetical protein [Streptomyces rhizosphaericus]